jgi:hypothetical protein
MCRRLGLSGITHVKKKRSAFREAEDLAQYLLDLRTEELRLRESLEQVRRARLIAMATLAIKADEASRVESAAAERRKGDRR